MRRIFISILVLFFLLGQLGLSVHAYEKHKDGQVCELCLATSQSQHALLTHTVEISLDANFFYQDIALSTGESKPDFHFYTSRAPPHHL